jgi:Mg-chelatase subunit ChlD
MVKKAFLLLAVISVVIYCASMAKFLANSRNLTRQIPTLTVTSHAGLPTTTSTSSDANPNEISEMPRLFTTREPEIVDNQRPRIDVVFAIDSTGSMGDEIEVVKQNIRNIINDISQATPTPDVRYGIVTYRDHGDEYITRKWMLTRNVAQIVTALNSLVAGGGGDKEEAVAEALHVGLHEINWDQRASSKLVFLIGDAGPHRDQSSNNDQVGSIIDWQTELNFAEKQGISINTIACRWIAGRSAGRSRQDL